MSLRIGMILSKDCKLDNLGYLKQMFELGLFQIKNNYVNKQLLNDEIFVQATESGCDSLSGIGSYSYYNKDTSSLYETMQNPILTEMFIKEFEERNNEYWNDALKWIQIIRLLKYKYKIDKVGIFHHGCVTGFDEEKINFVKRVDCNIKNVSVEYIMKIEEDVIVFFTS